MVIKWIFKNNDLPCIFIPVSSWFVSPVLSGMVSVGLFYLCKYGILTKVTFVVASMMVVVVVGVDDDDDYCCRCWWWWWWVAAMTVMVIEFKSHRMALGFLKAICRSMQWILLNLMKAASNGSCDRRSDWLVQLMTASRSNVLNDIKKFILKYFI